MIAWMGDQLFVKEIEQGTDFRDETQSWPSGTSVRVVREHCIDNY